MFNNFGFEIRIEKTGTRETLIKAVFLACGMQRVIICGLGAFVLAILANYAQILRGLQAVLAFRIFAVLKEGSADELD